MNARQAYSHRGKISGRRAVQVLVLTAMTVSGQMLNTAGTFGQDRIRIVESPRVAVRESRTVELQTRRPTTRSDQPANQIRQGSQSADPKAVLAEHFVTEMRDEYRTIYVPIIESQSVQTPAWWDPLRISANKSQPRPVVRWEKRVEKVRVPVRYRELVSEKTELGPGAITSTSSSQSTERVAGGNRSRATPQPTPARR